MLILTRRAGENVVIGDDIVVSVVEVRGDAVRIGIQAPRSVSVHRQEVWLELQRANEGAASPGEGAVAALGAEVGSLVPNGREGTHRPRRDRS